MPHNHSITRKRHFKHLTPFQRGQIQAFMKQKLPKAQIARILGISRSTLYYELKRGTVEQLDYNLNVKHVYFADTGQLVYNERRKNSKKPLYIHAAHDFLRHVEREIKEKRLSPDAIRGEAAKFNRFPVIVSTKTIYNYISKRLIDVKNIDLPLRVRLKTKKRTSRKHRRILGASIEERPTTINERLEFGHWEIDTIIGTQKGKEALLCIDERTTRKRHLIKIPSKTMESVRIGLLHIMQQYANPRSVFKSITADNGSEFSRLTQDILASKIYYAHPYSSFERGTNEKQNSLVRRFIPKKTDIADISDEYVKFVETWINNLPRKIFDYDCAESLFIRHLHELS